MKKEGWMQRMKEEWTVQMHTHCVIYYITSQSNLQLPCHSPCCGSFDDSISSSWLWISCHTHCIGEAGQLEEGRTIMSTHMTNFYASREAKITYLFSRMNSAMSIERRTCTKSFWTDITYVGLYIEKKQMLHKFKVQRSATRVRLFLGFLVNR